MATIKEQFDTSNQTITCTIASLANNGQRGSTAVDNSSKLYLDALVQIKAKSGSSGTLATGCLNIYAYGTADGGTDYSDGVSGTDGGVTLTSPPNVRLIGTLNMVANATQYVSHPFSVAAAFGGILPDHWGIIVENKTGATLDASGSGCWYQGLWNQAA